ncbi:unnamed protein product [Adineta ricciae]|nr:unnamed protein product [Adineta ricciae]
MDIIPVSAGDLNQKRTANEWADIQQFECEGILYSTFCSHEDYGDHEPPLHSNKITNPGNFYDNGDH